jgi:tryptophanyl-tRNA synthetase
MKKKKKKVVLSGMRPTGPLHLGHLAGPLRNWIKMQDEYRCFYTIVTWHALSSEYQNSKVIKEYTLELAVDWMSIGLDPNKSVLFVQSEVKEHAELHLVLSMVTPLPWLERVPTFKEMQRENPDKELNTYGFLGYPMLQAADILIYRADVVPVGEDQVYHLEFTREVARRFNRLYGKVFPEPQTLLSEVPRLAGIDGRKMSKSYGNAIFLQDPPQTMRQKIETMMTDVRRKRRTDPGEPEDCPAFTLHKAFVSQEKREELAQGCRTAGIGCLECKNVVIERLDEILSLYREKRKNFKKNPRLVWDILEEGNRRARDAAQKTMEEVRARLGF